MSGGRWGYQTLHIEDEGRRISGLYKFLAAVEHEMDWAESSDNCRPCTKERLYPALVAFFDGGRGEDPASAIALIRDHLQNRCPECEARTPRTPRRAG